MKETAIYLIENESENTKLDFKKEQYPIERTHPKKPEFLKDMCAFANLVDPADKYIIIGVIEESGIAADFTSIKTLYDQASYQQYLNEYIEPEINFEYSELIYKEHRLAYFRLFDNNQYPYLFKKDVTESQQKRSLYRTGMGFKRIGSSTRELRRDDLEKIYTTRFGAKDRSNDISFRLFLTNFKDFDLNRYGYVHLRVDAVNDSNQSINVDVELKIHSTAWLSAECTQDLQQKYAERQRNESMFASTNMLDKLHAPFVYLDLNVDFEKNYLYSRYNLTPKKGSDTGLRIVQSGSVSDIFNGQIAVSFSRPLELHVEITARSNDFPNGPKVFKYFLTKEVTYPFVAE